MKVCIVSSFSSKDGIGIYTQRLVKALKRNDVEVDVITSLKKIESQDNIIGNISYNPCRNIKMYLNFKKSNSDVLHIQYTITMYGLLALILWFFVWLAKQQKPIIITLHEVSSEEKRLKGFARIYYNLIGKLVCRFHVPTQKAKKILQNRCKVNESKISVIPLGIYEFEKEDTSFTQSIKKQLQITYEKLILYLGFIRPSKGIEYLIEASKILAEEYYLREKIKVIIAGDVRKRQGLLKIFEERDKKYLQFLYALRKNLQLEDFVEFIGFVSDKYLYSLLSLAHVVVLPYICVEQSEILNLALGFPKPIIGSNIGGISELIGKVGIVVPPREPKELAREITKILSDKNYYESIVNRYIQIKKEQNIEQIVKLVINDYQIVSHKRKSNIIALAEKKNQAV